LDLTRIWVLPIPYQEERGNGVEGISKGVILIEGKGRRFPLALKTYHVSNCQWGL